jgi:hypothetical protein
MCKNIGNHTIVKKVFAHKYLLFDALYVCSLLLLPYYIFGGFFFIGGDDTRLYHIFPAEWLQQFSSSSWFSFSSTGYYNPNFFLIPQLLVSMLLVKFLGQLAASYLLFSLPLILGYIFFILLIGPLLQHHSKSVARLGAIIYTTSPILMVGQMVNSLYAVWLVPAIPLFLFLFLKYVQKKHNSSRYLVYATLASLFFAQAFFSIPWLLGVLLVVLVSTALVLSFFKEFITPTFISKTLIFAFLLLLSNAFWLIPFTTAVLTTSQSSFGSKVFSEDIQETFARTVEVTAAGSITYPLLNLYQRKIAFDFDWDLKNVYLNHYDKYLFLFLVYPLLLGAGLYFAKSHLQNTEYRTYLFFLLCLVVALYLFTINIGVLKEAFIWLGKIPGMAMFRNAYDKFALTYIFFFALTLTFSLEICKRVSKKAYILIVLMLLVATAGAVLPVKEVINRKLWTTENYYTTTTLSKEYLDFVDALETRLPVGSGILSIPFGTATYTLVPAETRGHVYAGASPIKLLSGFDDYSGNFSFPKQTSILINKYIIEHDDKKLLNLLGIYNIIYAIETRGISNELLRSYLFNQKTITFQDNALKGSIFKDLALESSSDNYALYELNNNTDRSHIVTFPQKIYTNANDTQEGISTEGWDSLLGLIDDNSAYVPNYDYPDGTHVTNGAALLPSDDAPGTVYFDSSQHNTFNLVADLETSQLLATNVINDAFVNNTPFKPSIISELTSSSSVVSINGVYYDLTKSIPIASQDDEIGIYQLEDYKPSVPKLTNWAKIDCNSSETEYGSATFATSDDGNALSLKSEGTHNACIFQSIPVSPASLYKVSFEYKTDQHKLSVATFDQTGVSSQFTQEYEHGGTWQEFNFFVNSSTSSELTVYIYSGTDGIGANTSVKDFKIVEYDLAQVFSLRDRLSEVESGQQLFSGQLNVDKLSNITDVVKLGVTSPWQTADCNAIDSNPSTSFLIPNDLTRPDAVISLFSENKHNACIYQKLQIDHNYNYTLSFEYKPDTQNPTTLTYIGFDNGIEPLTYRVRGAAGIWQNADVSIPVLSDLREISVYLYSGSDNNHKTTSYRNIRLMKTPKALDNFFLIDDASFEPKEPPKLKSIVKMANDRYDLIINTTASSQSFFLNFKQAYHPGWSLLLSSTAEKIADHYEVNLATNGWYVDINTYCKQKNLCTQNPDGSYDIELTLEFFPQRWFYLGLLISGTTLVGCLGYLVYDFVKRRRTRKLATR